MSRFTRWCALCALAAAPAVGLAADSQAPAPTPINNGAIKFNFGRGD